MKRTFLLFTIASLCLVAACDVVENTDVDLSEAITYIRANGNENATKGSVDGSASFTWNTGDQIAVWTKNGYKVSDGLASTFDAQSTATFSFSGDNAFDQDDRANFAVFPASLVSGQTSCSAESLPLTLPASYTLAEVENNVSPTPMIAVNEPNGDLAFMALCPLLRITVNNIPKQTKRIEFDFNDKKVQGTFTLSGVAPATTAITTSSTSSTDDIITVTMEDNMTWHDYLVVNLPVPTGTYDKITITSYDADGLPILKLTKPFKSSGSWTPGRKTSSKMTATLPVFSAANGKYVTFAPGNLVATVTAVSEGAPTAVTWSFHANQYDRVFGWDGTQTLNQGDKIDLFGWGTSGWDNRSSDPSWVHFQPWSLSHADQSDDYSNNKWGYGPGYNASAKDLTGVNANGDWGVYNAIGDDPAGTWRLPTLSEYAYLLSTTTTSSHRETTSSGLPEGKNKKNTCASWLVATVNNIKGTIIFPDYYEHPSDATYTLDNFYGFNSGSGQSFAQFSVDADNWSKMETAGAIFLPVTGVRLDNNVYLDLSTHGYASSDYGMYWTSTRGGSAVTGQWARGYHFSKTGPGESGENTYVGFAVRLIRDLN